MLIDNVYGSKLSYENTYRQNRGRTTFSEMYNNALK